MLHSGKVFAMYWIIHWTTVLVWGNLIFLLVAIFWVKALYLGRMLADF
jgi:hypothetical protein